MNTEGEASLFEKTLAPLAEKFIEAKNIGNYLANLTLHKRERVFFEYYFILNFK